MRACDLTPCSATLRNLSPQGFWVHGVGTTLIYCSFIAAIIQVSITFPILYMSTVKHKEINNVSKDTSCSAVVTAESVDLAHGFQDLAGTIYSYAVKHCPSGLLRFSSLSISSLQLSDSSLLLTSGCWAVSSMYP